MSVAHKYSCLSCNLNSCFTIVLIVKLLLSCYEFTCTAFQSLDILPVGHCICDFFSVELYKVYKLLHIFLCTATFDIINIPQSCKYKSRGHVSCQAINCFLQVLSGLRATIQLVRKKPKFLYFPLSCISSLKLGSNLFDFQRLYLEKEKMQCECLVVALKRQLLWSSTSIVGVAFNNWSNQYAKFGF